MTGRLQGKVAVVTGASRGSGRGIAQVLGEEGATVYVTGRSVRGNTTYGDDFPETTIQQTAEEVTARGGKGIPVQVDHTDDAQVKALCEKIKREQGGLDILVNNVWGGYEGIMELDFSAPLWKQPIWLWDKMVNAGLRAHVVMSHNAAPLMLEREGGLVVTVTFYDEGKRLSNVPYDVVKMSKNRFAYSLAVDLKPYGVASVALSPGFMRTEAVMHVYKDVTDWATHPELKDTESVEYIGRAVAALASDPDVLTKNGQTLTVGALAQAYSFTDVDGRVIPPFAIGDEHLNEV